MPHDPARLADTRGWLIKAAQDLRAADLGLSASPPLAADVVFHCQQIAEKALKAFLAWHDRPFRKTHDLGELGQQCAAIQPVLEPVLRRAAVVTEYAWKFRYPGEPHEPSREEAAGALATARELHAAIFARLPVEVTRVLE
ncbi:MAG: HEPN domain-containing protein [Armatimonadota bacterium]